MQGLCLQNYRNIDFCKTTLERLFCLRYNSYRVAIIKGSRRKEHKVPFGSLLYDMFRITAKKSANENFYQGDFFD